MLQQLVRQDKAEGGGMTPEHLLAMMQASYPPIQQVVFLSLPHGILRIHAYLAPDPSLSYAGIEIGEEEAAQWSTAQWQAAVADEIVRVLKEHREKGGDHPRPPHDQQQRRSPPPKAM